MLVTETIQEQKQLKPDIDCLSMVRNLLKSCIQCGTCTGSCPNEFAMDLTPRHLWRLVLTGRKTEIFNSKTFNMCSSCYSCTLRCPRGLKLTEAMHLLKQIAIRQKIHQYKRSSQFYKNFMESVQRYGRVHETNVMTKYLLAMETSDPLALFKFAPLGLKLLSKGKLDFHFSSKGNHSLTKMYTKIKELEATP